MYHPTVFGNTADDLTEGQEISGRTWWQDAAGALGANNG